MLKVGVIGAGFMGGTHARAYAKLSDVQVVGVVSRSEERAHKLAAEVGARAFTDARQLIGDPEINAISVAVPTPLHRQYAVAALEAGKHVLVEKPIALTLDDADAIIEAADRAGRKLMVGQVLRFWPEYMALKETVASGQLGWPLWVSAWRLSFTPDWAAWLRQPEMTGGVAVDMMIHDFDAVNWIMGQPRSVFATGLTGASGGLEHVVAQVRYDGGQASVEGSHEMPDSWPFSAGLRVICNVGTIEYVFRAGGPSVEMGKTTSSLAVYPGDGEAQVLEVQPGDAYENEIAYFAHCVAEDQPIERATPPEARQALVIALAAGRSIERGQPVEV